MAVLRPYPFGSLVRRAFRELAEQRSVFDLPLAHAFFGDPSLDLSVRFHGHHASSPFGPAAGPQSQLAQNIVLSWLGGGRIVELKTVQVNDQLTLPRPCIDVRTVGFNIEWSQELTLDESLAEYVKASMLIEMLVASGELPLAPGFGRTVFDMSVGYDLAGIAGERVQRFIQGLLDAGSLVARLRAEIPDECRHLRDVPFTTRIADTLTLSTFHGCPPDEIERILAFLLEKVGLHCVVKLNPMLLGPAETRRILNEVLGYHDVRVPESAFEKDTTWPQMVEFVGRLRERAAALGRGFGAKFTNTLVVENHDTFFPATERVSYLSGPPLHVMAMQLVARFRAVFGDTVPVSFSAGIDRTNFADAVGLGLVPVTVCTDLLRPRGYARSRGYFDALRRRMRAAGAASVDELVVLGGGFARQALDTLDVPHEQRTRAAGALERGESPRAACSEAVWRQWVSAARLLNTRAHAERVLQDPHYARPANARPPRKIGRHLQLFDCITCDKCIPVCPNDANFAFLLPAIDIPIVKARRTSGGWEIREEGALRIEERHQIGNIADFCNDCGNCDVFCPEDGGPYIIKPRFFLTADAWTADRPRDGFVVSGGPEAGEIRGRFAGREFHLEVTGGRARFAGEGFEVTFDEDTGLPALGGWADDEVDLTYCEIMQRVRRAVLDPATVNYLTCLRAVAAPQGGGARGPAPDLPARGVD
jgi:putative selenate reductase